MTKKWPENLRTYIAENYKSVSAFAQENGIPRTTVRDWLRGNKPTRESAEKIKAITGIEMYRVQIDSVSIPISENKRNIFLGAFTRVITNFSRQLIDFVRKSSEEDRKLVREMMSENMEDLIDGSRGLYSEQSRKQMLSDRSKRNENTRRV